MSAALKALESERVALVGRLKAVDGAIALLRKGAVKAAPVGKRHIGPQGLARIKAAQRARWQAYHKQQAALAKGK